MTGFSATIETSGKLPSFFKSNGVTRATFQSSGTFPVVSDQFINVIIIGTSSCAHFFTSQVGIGSRIKETACVRRGGDVIC